MTEDLSSGPGAGLGGGAEEAEVLAGSGSSSMEVGSRLIVRQASSPVRLLPGVFGKSENAPPISAVLRTHFVHN